MPFHTNQLDLHRQAVQERAVDRPRKAPLGVVSDSDLNRRGISQPSQATTKYDPAVPGTLWTSEETETLVAIMRTSGDISECFDKIHRTEDAIKRKWRKV